MNGKTVKSELFAFDEKKRYFHIYYSDYRKAKERARLNSDIRDQKEYLESIKGTNVKIDGRYTEYFDLIYYHEGKNDQVLQFVREKWDVISRAIKLCGYFCIITSLKMSIADALDSYKSRDASEKLFWGINPIWESGAYGRIMMNLNRQKFIEFVALIVRNKIYTCLKDRMKELQKKKNYMTVPVAMK